MKSCLKFFRKKTKRASGFSLVEVLCAIVLLALVATPILQSIFSSMNLNLKSRKLLAASDLTSGVMEFVSSTVFDDYEYTKTGESTPTKVPGLASYYWGGATGTGSIGSCKLSNGNAALETNGKLYPNGPTCKYDSYSGGSLTHRTLKITNADMDGFKFDVIIDMTAPSSSSTAEYFCYDVNVKVYEKGTDKLLSEAATKIANKY